MTASPVWSTPGVHRGSDSWRKASDPVALGNGAPILQGSVRELRWMRDLMVLSDDGDIRQLMTHFRPESDLLARYVDLVVWLRPDLHILGSDRGAAAETLKRIGGGAVGPRSSQAVRDLLLLIDRIAATYVVAEPANSMVQGCLKEAIGPAFDADSFFLLTTLDTIGSELRHQLVRDLVTRLQEHYRDVIALTDLLRGYVGQE